MTTIDADSLAPTAIAPAWLDAFEPTNALQLFLVGQVAHYAARIEAIRRDRVTALKALSLRARHAWDNDRRLAAEDIAVGLRRNPARTVHRLRQTLQGAEWLIGRWEILARLADRADGWDDQRRALALDLLGVPRDLRDPADAPWLAPGESPSTVARRALDELQACCRESLVPLDAAERAAATAGEPTSSPKSLLALAREEAACLRNLESSLKRLQPPSPRGARTASPRARQTLPAPTTEPEPRPEIEEKHPAPPTGFEDDWQPDPQILLEMQEFLAARALEDARLLERTRQIPRVSQKSGA